MRVYIITLEGSMDGGGVVNSIELEMTPNQAQFLNLVAQKITANASNDYMPTMSVMKRK